MFAHDLCHRQIEKTERSNTTNSQPARYAPARYPCGSQIICQGYAFAASTKTAVAGGYSILNTQFGSCFAGLGYKQHLYRFFPNRQLESFLCIIQGHTMGNDRRWIDAADRKEIQGSTPGLSRIGISADE